MACGAGLIDFEEQRIAVAVDKNLPHFLYMAGRFSLKPTLCARAAVIDHDSRFKRLGQRIAVHEGKHQHFAGRQVLRDGRNESLVVEFYQSRAGSCAYQLSEGIMLAPECIVELPDVPEIRLLAPDLCP